MYPLPANQRHVAAHLNLESLNTHSHCLIRPRDQRHRQFSHPTPPVSDVKTHQFSLALTSVGLIPKIITSIYFGPYFRILSQTDVKKWHLWKSLYLFTQLGHNCIILTSTGWTLYKCAKLYMGTTWLYKKILAYMLPHVRS